MLYLFVSLRTKETHSRQSRLPNTMTSKPADGNIPDREQLSADRQETDMTRVRKVQLVFQLAALAAVIAAAVFAFPGNNVTSGQCSAAFAVFSGIYLLIAAVSAIRKHQEKRQQEKG